jgi:alkanesulfonate monooxygenase SsuD/methylene tetrahydromethanopterin reductase-like flavin-dependent oxidoreductase (luciferase family)
MELGAFLMPVHPPEQTVRDGQLWDLNDLERLDALGFAEAWIGEHFTAAWEPCPAPDLLIAQALQRTKKIRLGPLGHLLPYHLSPYQPPHPPIAIAGLTPGSENHKLAGEKGYIPVSLAIDPDASVTLRLFHTMTPTSASHGAAVCSC